MFQDISHYLCCISVSKTHQCINEMLIPPPPPLCRPGMVEYRGAAVFGEGAVRQGGGPGLLHVLLHQLHAHPA